MRPHLIFWISALVRIVLILAGAGACGYLWGAKIGFGIAALGMLGLVVMQLQYLLSLSDWLENPTSTRLPDGWGAWTEVFSRLYKLRREDEKNQAELAEWLARFRQAMTLLPDGVVIMDDVMFLEWCSTIA